MQISLKWMLIGTAYVALVMAAIARPHWILIDLLQLATFLSVVYATIVAFVGRGLRRHVAIGFATASLLLVAFPEFSAGGTPVQRVVDIVFPPEPIPAARTPYVANSKIQLYAARHRSANSAAVLFMGLIGAVLGAIVYRRASAPLGGTTVP
jgi:hypothetical protein